MSSEVSSFVTPPPPALTSSHLSSPPLSSEARRGLTHALDSTMEASSVHGQHDTTDALLKELDSLMATEDTLPRIDGENSLSTIASSHQTDNSGHMNGIHVTDKRPEPSSTAMARDTTEAATVAGVKQAPTSSEAQAGTAAAPQRTEPGKGVAARGLRVRFLPLDLLHIYTGMPLPMYLGHDASATSGTAPGAPMLLTRTTGIAKYVLVHDQRGPVAVVPALCISAPVRKLGVALADLEDNILVKAGAAAGSTGSGTLRAYLDGQEGARLVSEGGGVTVASQVVVAACLQPLYDHQYHGLARSSAPATPVKRSPRSRSISPRARSPRPASESVEPEVLEGARLLQRLGLQEIIASNVLAALERTFRDLPGESLPEPKSASTELPTSSGGRPRRDSDASMGSTLSKGSLASGMSGTSLSKPGVRLSSIRSRAVNATQSTPSKPSNRSDGLLPRPSRTEVASSPSRRMAFHYEPESVTLGGISALHKEFARYVALSCMKPNPPSNMGIGGFASESMLHPGDIVLAVDDKAVVGCTTTEVMTYLVSQAVEDGVVVRVARPISVLAGVSTRSQSSSARLGSAATRSAAPSVSTPQHTRMSKPLGQPAKPEPARSTSRKSAASISSAKPTSALRIGGATVRAAQPIQSPSRSSAFQPRSHSAQPRPMATPNPPAAAGPKPFLRAHSGARSSVATPSPLPVRSTSRSSATSSVMRNTTTPTGALPRRPQTVATPQSRLTTAARPVQSRAPSASSVRTPLQRPAAVPSRPSSAQSRATPQPRPSPAQGTPNPSALGLSRAAAAAFIRTPDKTPAQPRSLSNSRPSALINRPTNASLLAAKSRPSSKEPTSMLGVRPTSASTKGQVMSTPVRLTSRAQERPTSASKIAPPLSTSTLEASRRAPLTSAGGTRTATTTPVAAGKAGAPVSTNRSASRPRAPSVGKSRGAAPADASHRPTTPTAIPTIRGGKPTARDTPGASVIFSPVVTALTSDIDTALADAEDRPVKAYAPATAELLGALADLASQLED